MGIDYPIEKA